MSKTHNKINLLCRNPSYRVCRLYVEWWLYIIQGNRGMLLRCIYIDDLGTIGKHIARKVFKEVTISPKQCHNTLLTICNFCLHKYLVQNLLHPRKQTSHSSSLRTHLIFIIVNIEMLVCPQVHFMGVGDKA